MQAPADVPKRYRYLEETARRKKSLVREYGLQSRLVREKQADGSAALPLLQVALDIQFANLDKASVGQSTRQQLVAQARTRGMLDNFLSLALRQNLDDDAFARLLTWKGSIASRQRVLHAVSDQPTLQPLWLKLQEVTAELSRGSRTALDDEQQDNEEHDLARLSEQKESIERELAGKSVAFRVATQPPTAAQLQAALPVDTALIDFLEYNYWEPPPKAKPGPFKIEQRLTAFVVRHDGQIRRFDFGASRPIVTAVNAWRAGLGQTAAAKAAGAELRKVIWEPLESQLAGAKVVLVSPDGLVGKLPFAALPGRNPDTYLIEDYALAVISAPQEIISHAATLAAGPPAEHEASGLLALGAVNYDDRQAASAPATSSEEPIANDLTDLVAANRSAAPRGLQGKLRFTPLPATASEVDAIEKRFRAKYKSEAVTRLAGSDATTAALRAAAPKSAYLHLATHGFFAPEAIRSALSRDLQSSNSTEDRLATSQTVAGFHPNLLSGLALAGANAPQPDDDGILTAEDVESLNLTKVELVVLSACETGLGQTAGGEGLLGLQRAFGAAGAKTVIASLWAVPDEATRDLMERFYSNLWNKRMGKLEALREAQLWMLRGRDAQSVGRLRGLAAEDDDLPAAQGVPPRYWAAFVLSGDWR